MRGTDERPGSLFSYVDLEMRVPTDHPLRAIREIANGARSDLSADFAAMYAPLGRRAWHRRCGLGPLGVLQEPGQTARRRYRGQVHGGGLDPTQRQAAFIHDYSANPKKTTTSSTTC